MISVTLKESGKTVWLNPDYIVWVEDKDSATYISLHRVIGCLAVLETAKEVALLTEKS